MLDDDLYTETSAEQLLLEEKVLQFLAPFAEEGISPEDDRLQLNREGHVVYLQGSMQELPPGFVALDASRTWICYWLVHSLALLEAPLPDSLTTAGLSAEPAKSLVFLPAHFSLRPDFHSMTWCSLYVGVITGP
jgi:protein farnesyltransferase subunit beta